jgi:hypothetical protein
MEHLFINVHLFSLPKGELLKDRTLLSTVSCFPQHPSILKEFNRCKLLSGKNK